MGRKPRRTATREKASGPSERFQIRPRTPASYSRPDAVLFSLTLFLSAALLFTVEPMFAKMVLPLLGGAPAVWNACLVFYQAVLLAGYLYAHLSLKWLGPRRQAVLHLVLLCLAAWVSLPIGVAKGWLPPATTFPAPWLWMLLGTSLGLPLLAISASAPMLQAWFSETVRPGNAAQRDPYFLYAASNLGSLLALLAYPFWVEGHLTLLRQSRSWAIGYALLAVLIAACALLLWRAKARQAQGSAPAQDRQDTGQVAVRSTVRRRLRWLALSLVPSGLLLGVTTYLTAELTPRPLLWVVPLALYLLSFVLVFAPGAKTPSRWMVRWQPILIVITVGTLFCTETGIRDVLALGALHLATFFVTAMVCHGQLAADRPEPSQLTEYYLWMSLGGVVGGLLCALVAPLIFNSVLEYPLLMVAACLLRPKGLAESPLAGADAAGVCCATGPQTAESRPRAGTVAEWLRICRRERLLLPAAALFLAFVISWGLRSGSFLSGWQYTDSPVMRLAMVLTATIAAFLLRRRPAVFAAAVATLAAISLSSVEAGTELLHAERSFFGILRVEYDPVWNTHQLMHGTTTHGQQNFSAGQRLEPQCYYHRSGPLGAIFDALRARRPLAEIGVLGLGAGTIAAYAEPGERITYYEIDPAVERIARNSAYFTFLTDCRGKVEVILGDARLSLERGPERKFDILIGDVFSSDSVPVHLMTGEALKIYWKRLQPRGLLVLHISSRYLNLAPVMGNLAAEAGLTARIWRDLSKAGPVGREPSSWVVMARRAEDLGPLAEDGRFVPLAGDGEVAWSDDFSNVTAALRWDAPARLPLISWRWMKSRQAEGHDGLAPRLLEEGRIDEAMEHWQKSLAIEPDNAQDHFSLGVALAGRGRLDEGIEHLQQALKLEPDYPAAHSELGVLLDRKGKGEEALQQCLLAVQLAPGYIEGLSNMGDVLMNQKKHALAADCYRKAVSLRPASAELHFDLGRALAEEAKIKEALEELHQALGLADGQKEAALVEKIQAEIRRCKAWPWEEEKKKGK